MCIRREIVFAMICKLEATYWGQTLKEGVADTSKKRKRAMGYLSTTSALTMQRQEEAEAMLEEARATALTFFEKKKPKDQELDYKFREPNSRYSDKISLSDCEDQLREWAAALAVKEIEKRPEGAKLKQLRDLKEKALDTVMEAGTPDSLAIALDQVSKKIGLNWDQDLKALPSVN